MLDSSVVSKTGEVCGVGGDDGTCTVPMPVGMDSFVTPAVSEGFEGFFLEGKNKKKRKSVFHTSCIGFSCLHIV
jgi:hypothetical protein